MNVHGRLVMNHPVITAIVHLVDDLQPFQLEQDLRGQPDRDAVSGRKLIRRIGRLLLGEPLRDQRGDQQRQEILVAPADVLAISLKAELAGILRGKSDLCPKKADQPLQLQPKQQQRQRRKATIDRIILAHPNLSTNI